jgi:DNA helicase-2/ATP-dependent DNA helicase PcrA
VHRVKGLEWDHVLVFGVDRGTMPHALSEDVEEERRVFHVAMTRGRRTVTLLVDEARPSRFLSEIEGTASRDPEPPPPVAQTPARIPRDAVFVVPGDELVLAGGYRGAVSEVLTTGVLVRLSGTDTVMSVPFGEKVTRGDVSGPVAPGGGSPDSALVERLKAWRLAQARSQGVPAYVVFSDRTLEALIALRPDTEEALLRVPGIGPAKLEAYGDQILALVTDVPPHA